MVNVSSDLSRPPGYLEYLTDAILSSVNLDTAKGHKLKLLKVITSPFTSLVIKVRGGLMTHQTVMRAARNDGVSTCTLVSNR